MKWIEMHRKHRTKRNPRKKAYMLEFLLLIWNYVSTNGLASTVVGALVVVALLNLNNVVFNTSIHIQEKMIESLSLGVNAEVFFGKYNLLYRPLKRSKELFWCACSENYYLFVRVDESKNISGYTVISRNNRFRPFLPLTESRLGKESFSSMRPEVGPHGAVFGRGSEYYELYASARSTGYKPLYVGYYDRAGAEFRTNRNSFSMNDLIGEHIAEEKLEIFRKNTFPNAYTFGDSFLPTVKNSHLITHEEIFEIKEFCAKRNESAFQKLMRLL